IVGAIAAVGAIAGTALLKSLTSADGITTDAWRFALHVVLFVAAGISILVMAAGDLWRRRDATALTLAAWLAGTVIFAGFVNWTTNVRSVLPIVPAAALIVGRAAEDWGWTKLRWNMTAGVIAASAVVSLWIARGDHAFATAEAEAVDAIRRRTAGH